LLSFPERHRIDPIFLSPAERRLTVEVLIIIALQYIVSAKAGWVNYVDGQANVQPHQQVAVAMPIETGPRSHAELLLSPGSFLRLGEQARVVFDSVDLTDIAVRVLEGVAVVEVADVDSHAPIRVSTGNLRTVIVSPGLYRFVGDTAVVVDGKLRTADSRMTIKKGKQVSAAGDSYIENRTELAFADDLDRWSAQRTASLARANALAYRRYTANNGYWLGGYSPSFVNGSAWLYSPLLNGFTFIPRNPYRSYYGVRFVPRLTFGLTPGGIGRSVSTSEQSSNRISGHNGPTSTRGRSSGGLSRGAGARIGGHR
jgi:FecR protein